jgi:uncharacterized protein
MKQQAFETGGITQSIVAFAEFARSHGMNLGLTETQQALQAAADGLLAQRNHFKSALKTLWCKSPEEVRIFEKLFLLYWDTNPVDLQPNKNKTSFRGVVEKKTNASLVMLGMGKTAGPETDAKKVSGANEAERLRKTDLSRLNELDASMLNEISKKLLKEMSIRMRRRMKKNAKKGQINLRRTIRHSIPYGGEPLELFRLAKKIKKQRLIIFLDVSGSMDQYSWFLLRFICALREQFRQLEAFIFSTSLLRITKALQQNRLDLVLSTIAKQAENWSGGTRIGHCLRTFNEQYGKQFLNGSPTVMILSDGLDTGLPEQLAKELSFIRSRAKRIIWLNPLKGTAGYEPIARGMNAALPLINEFRPAHNLESLLELEKILQYV